MELRYVPHGTTSRSSEEEMDDAVQKVWDEFWQPVLDEHAPIVHGPDVVFTAGQFRQIQGELFDAHNSFANLSEVYHHFSHGATSNPLVLPAQVIEIAEEKQREETGRDIIEFLEMQQDDFDDQATKDLLGTIVERAKQEWPESS